MESAKVLEKIRDDWIRQVSSRLANVEGLREKIRGELQNFFDLLLVSVRTGRPDHMDPILNSWGEALTTGDLEDSAPTLTNLCGEIFQETVAICAAKLDGQESLALLQPVTAIMVHVMIAAGQLEKERELTFLQQRMDNLRGELERLDKSKSDFISVAAHELKTPLTLIEGYTAMFRELLEETDYSQHLQLLLEGMDQGADRLRRIIDDMIDVSLIDNNLLTLNFQPIWLNRMFAMLDEEFRQRIQQRKQELVILAFPGSNELLFADPERLHQAFRNLLSNAIKFTPDGGSITIDGRKLPGFVEITFTDTGIGIPQVDQLRIFEKFNRIGDAALHSSGTVKFKGGGPGLGLPITKGIIEAHGGALWVESEGYDEVQYPGSAFHVLIPARKEPPDEQIAKLFRPLTEMENR